MCVRVRRTGTTEEDGSVCSVFLSDAELQPQSSSSCDIHGAGPSLSAGPSPSAAADKSNNFMCSCQTPQVCFVCTSGH